MNQYIKHIRVYYSLTRILRVRESVYYKFLLLPPKYICISVYITRKILVLKKYCVHFIKY